LEKFCRAGNQALGSAVYRRRPEDKVFRLVARRNPFTERISAAPPHPLFKTFLKIFYSCRRYKSKGIFAFRENTSGKQTVSPIKDKSLP